MAQKTYVCKRCNRVITVNGVTEKIAKMMLDREKKHHWQRCGALQRPAAQMDT